MSQQTAIPMTSRSDVIPIEALVRFDRWIGPELPFLWRFCCRYHLHGYCDADDLFQETVLRAFAAIDRFDGHHPRAWLATIARNTAITMWRKRSSQPTAAFNDHVHDRIGDEWASRPEADVLRRMPDPRLVSEVRGLPSPFRETVQLVDVGGRTYREAAEILEIPMGTVMSRLHRGRARLRQAFADTPSPPSGSEP